MIFSFARVVLACVIFFASDASAAERFAPEIDVSSITTWDDYYEVKNASWGRYYDRKNEAFSEYYDKKNEAFSEYSDFSKEKLIELRSLNFDVYLKWLDAKEIGDYERRMELERTVPEIMHYVAVVAERYEQYEEEEAALAAEYDAIEAAASANHEREVEMAREAYESHTN